MRRRAARRLRVAGLTAITSLVLVAGAIAALHSPLFEASAIQVTGASRYTTEEILSAAGLSRGTNAFYLNTDQVEARLEKDPWIAEATVDRSLPKTISVDVVERIPVAATESAGQFQTLAADGTVLAGSAQAPDLPLVVVADVGDLGSACRLAGAMKSSLLQEVDSIEADAAGEVVVNLSSGLTVAYGGFSDAQAKAQSLTSLLRWGQDQQIEFISADVSVPTAPSAKIAGGATVTPTT